MKSYIFQFQILWDILPEPKYLMIADFVRYYTNTSISHGYRLHEIIHHNHNISWLPISWDITPKLQYLMVPDVLRYLITITISHECKFLEILYLKFNNSWLQISWYITPDTKKCLFVFFLFVCLSIFLSLCLFVFLSFCLFVFLSFCLLVFLSLSLSFAIKTIFLLSVHICPQTGHQVGTGGKLSG